MMPEPGTPPPPRDITYASFDDLKLHVRHYPAPDEKARSVICLPGLTRNACDFNQLATHLSTPPEHARGLSVDRAGDAAQRLLRRLSRAGAFAIRPQLAELHPVHRADRRARL